MVVRSSDPGRCLKAHGSKAEGRVLCFTNGLKMGSKSLYEQSQFVPIFLVPRK